MVRFYWINDWIDNPTDLHIIDITIFSVDDIGLYLKTYYGFEARLMNFGFGVQFTRTSRSKDERQQRSFDGGRSLLQKHVGGAVTANTARS